jgi:hypothetical protein
MAQHSRVRGVAMGEAGELVVRLGMALLDDTHHGWTSTGPCGSARPSLGRSVNTYFVWLEEQVGAEKVIATAQRVGIVFRSDADAQLAQTKADTWGSSPSARPTPPHRTWPTPTPRSPRTGSTARRCRCCPSPMRRGGRYRILGLSGEAHVHIFRDIQAADSTDGGGSTLLDATDYPSPPAHALRSPLMGASLCPARSRCSPDDREHDWDRFRADHTLG